MHITLLIYGSIDTVSGGYLYNRQLVHYLREQGDKVEILSLPYRNYWAHLQDNFSAEFHQILTNLQTDILIQDEMNHPSLAWINSQIPRPFPIVSLVHLLRATERHPKSQRAFYHAVEDRYLRSVDGLIVTSQTTETEIKSRFQIEKPTVVAVPAGDRFGSLMPNPTREPHNNLRLLYVGNVIRRKGLHTILEAMALATNTELSVVGPLDVEPGYTQEIEQLITRHSLQARVQLHGALDGDALIKQYRQADLFVMPAYYESFGIVYLEAMGFGLPAVGTTGGAAHELITHKQNGFLIEPDDYRALARYFMQLQQNPEQLQTIGRAARKRFELHSSWDDSMANIRTFLEGLI